jgi:hypothetical protein
MPTSSDAEHTIGRVRSFLMDRVNNDLTLILMDAEPGVPGGEARLRRVQGAVRRIAEALAGLSQETVREWERRYAHTGLAPAEEGHDGAR